MNYNTYVNAETGVMEEGVFIEREVYEKRMLAKERKQAGSSLRKKMDEFSEHVNLNLGSFFFNQYNKLFKEIGNNSALAFRFIYLCTYADYDGVLRYGIYKNGKHHDYMTEKDFREVFGLSKNMITSLKSDLFSHSLVVENDGKLIINKSYCRRGSQSKNTIIESTRIFDTGIQNMYKSSKALEHKRIGLLLLLIPYVNKTHNVLCSNPYEQEVQLIAPLGMKEIAGILGYTSNNYRKLKSDLKSIYVCNEYSIVFVDSKNCKLTYINPRIYYAGNDISSLKSLCDIFQLANITNTK